MFGGAREDEDVCRGCGQWQGDCACECPHCTHAPVPVGYRCPRCGQWHDWCSERRRDAVAAIHELYLEAERRPCPCCGDKCESQFEFVESNGGLPWEFCSRCDPGMREDGEADPCRCSVATALASELSKRQIAVLRAVASGSGFFGGWVHEARKMADGFPRNNAVHRNDAELKMDRLTVKTSSWPKERYALTELGQLVLERLPKDP